MREILTLILPPDPRLAPLGRLAALHFLRHNGFSTATSRRRALQIGTACRRLLGGRVGPGRTRGAVRIRMVAGASGVEVLGGGTDGRFVSILRIARVGRPGGPRRRTG